METNFTIQDDVFCLAMNSGSKTALNAALISVLVVSFIGNTSVGFLVARHYQLHTVTNGYIVNMAVTHLLFALFCAPLSLKLLSIHPNENKRVSSTLCAFVFVFFTTLSSLSLSLIALDRYHVIRTSGRNKISHKTAKKTIASSWVLALLLSTSWVLVDIYYGCKSPSSRNFMVFPPMLIPSCNETARIADAVCITLIFFLPSSFMFMVFARIWKPMWSGLRQIRPLGGGHLGSIRLAAEIRTTQTMFVILISFYICWGPYFFVSFHNIFKQVDRWRHFYCVTVCLAFGNCCVCPLIYIIRNPRISLILARNKPSKKRENFSNRVSSEMSRSQPYYISWARGRANTSMFDRSNETMTTSVLTSLS